MSSGIRSDSGLFLQFRLDIDADGWPPFGSESLPVTEHETGIFEVMVPPLFLKDLSVGDRISVDLDDENYVTNWAHESQSDRSTIWLLKGSSSDMEPILNRLKKLKCNVERLSKFDLCSIDVPASTTLSEIDEIIAIFETDGGQVAYPSFRH